VKIFWRRPHKNKNETVLTVELGVGSKYWNQIFL
jgi:hypothetical protein